jgi:hypothetical protein
VFVGDFQAGQVDEFDAQGRPIASATLSSGGAIQPSGMAVDAHGDLFVIDDITSTLYRFAWPRK